jgi:Transcriptional regulator, AbiEi antitoxin
VYTISYVSPDTHDIGIPVALRGLPAVFTYSQARAHGIPDRQLYRLRDEGVIESIARGMYRRHDLHPADIDLVETVLRAPDATLCLTTALARHQLSDAIPAVIDLALPRGRRRPSTTAPIAWHSFDPATFEIGRDVERLDDEVSIGIYGAERSIIDAFRLRHLEGRELGNEALKRWLRRKGASPARLLTMARHLPRAERPLREALEILL